MVFSNRIKSFIVEDDKTNVNVLERLISEKCPEIQNEGYANNIETAIEFLKANDVDIVFMDIEIGDRLSFEILDNIPNFKFVIIFITGFNQHAIKAIKYAAIDYLLKPIDPNELSQAVNRAIRAKNSIDYSAKISFLIETLFDNKDKQQKIPIPTLNGLQFLQLSDITAIEADGSYSKIHFFDKSFILASKSLKIFEELLEDKCFMRIHHSFLININKIDKYIKGNGGQVVMDNGKVIDVSLRKKDEFLKRIKL